VKHWAQRQATSGGTLEPSAVNDELRAQQSSITTLDRDQLPDNYADEARVKDYALLRGYVDAQYPAGSGEQDTVVETYIGAGNMWDSVTFRVYPGGWKNVSAGNGIELTGFKGGHLHIEWTGNGYIFGSMASGANIPSPDSPRYLNLRITVNGVTIAEKRGPGCHEAFRVIGSSLVPQGDVKVRLQWRITGPSEDDAVNTTAGLPVPQAHLYGMRYLAIGRWR
jgi:hypothetical protein